MIEDMRHHLPGVRGMRERSGARGMPSGLGTLKATIYAEAGGERNGYTYPRGPVQALWFESGE